MKPRVIAYRMSLTIGFALSLGLFTLSSVNSQTDPDLTVERGGNRTNTSLAQEKPSPPSTETASSAQDKVKKKEVFPGSRIKAEAAVKKARLIIVAKFTDPGIRSFDSPGKTVHGMAKVEVLQILKGYVSQELSLTFEVYNDPPYIVEKTPEVGQRYIIFINEKAVMSAIKFLPDSDEQRWHVMELISSAADERH